MLAALFFARVHHDPHYIPDALVGKPLPSETLPPMAGGAPVGASPGKSEGHSGRAQPRSGRREICRGLGGATLPAGRRVRRQGRRGDEAGFGDEQVIFL